jgi:uncharacterized protein with PIN domain
MKMNYSYNEMKRAFECGRNFQLTGDNNFDELIEDITKESEKLYVCDNCEELFDFYLGTYCHECSRSFRAVKDPNDKNEKRNYHQSH